MAWSGKVGVDFVGSIVLTDGDGAPDTGLAAELTVSVQNPADDASDSPAVSESTQVPGLYLFTIPGAFLTAVGQYGVVITKTTVPRATVSELLDVKAADIDDVKADTTATRYLGSVWIDTANGTPGDVVGVNGLPGLPVTTLADALSIADATGLRSLTIVTGNLTLTESLTEFLVELRDESELNFGGQSVNGSEFRGGIVKGAMSGVITVRNGHIEDVTGYRGDAQMCGLRGTITLGAGTTTFDLCHSDVPGTQTPTIVFGDPTSEFSLRAYSGGMQVEGMTLPAHLMTAEFVAGQLIIDGSCTGGTLAVRGIVGPLIDNSAGTTIVTSGEVSKATVADTVWTEVLAPHEVAPGSAAEAIASLRNRIRIDFTADPPELVVYDQAGTAELYRSPLTTTNGTEVIAFFGMQHERGVPV